MYSSPISVHIKSLVLFALGDGVGDGAVGFLPAGDVGRYLFGEDIFKRRVLDQGDVAQLVECGGVEEESCAYHGLCIFGRTTATSGGCCR